MALKSYLIAPEGGGLQRDVEPWLLPDDAFFKLEDAYVWRGRIRKRFGTAFVGKSGATDLNTRLRIKLGTTDGNGDLSGTVPGAVFKVGQMFSIGTEIFTVNVTGAPAALLDTGSATTATYDTTAGTGGAYVFVGAAATTDVYFYPAEPVMGLRLRESTSYNFEETVAFDTQFAYGRTAGAWERISTIPAADASQWTGSNSKFFWTTNYRGATPETTTMYVTNFVATTGTKDGIQMLPQGSSTWTLLVPQLDVGAGTRFLNGARIIIPFKDRLVTLNTLEGPAAGPSLSYVNRARWSGKGDPTAASTAWIDVVPGKAGGYIDAPTKEAIITANLLKDRLIVYFERSTYELVYTADSQLPYRWQQINSELGAESTFSVIGFDDVALGVGNVGIHACDGVSVKRVDQKIPDEVFDIHNGEDGVERVYGIRDYYRELVYWTVPDASSNPTYPTRVLLLDYAKGNWAYINDSFTCFGYLQFDADTTWADLGVEFGTWNSWNEPWGSAQVQSQFPFIVAGNQEGWTFILNTDKSFNSQSLYITNMSGKQLTVVDHNLKDGDYVRVEDGEGSTNLNGTIFPVISVVDADNVTIDTAATGTYTGNGKLTRISGLNIQSAQWNPGTPVGQQFRMPYMDFLFDVTDAGEVSVQYYGEFNDSNPVNQSPASDNILGTSTVSTTDETPFGDPGASKRLWKRFFLAFQSSTIQIRIFLNDAQLRNYEIATSDFQLNATQLYAEPGGRITG